jgi:very-short-patch-repair endonuclease
MTILIFCFVLILLVVLVFLKMKPLQMKVGPEFAKKEPLFTLAERSFLGVLEQSLDDRFRVLGKVRLGDIVKPAKGLSKSRFATVRNQVNQKHVDFVVCSMSTMEVVGVVELDDKSHDQKERSARDQLVDRALADAKIPIIHFPAQKGYVLAEVRATLSQKFAISAPHTAPPVLKVIRATEIPVSTSKEATSQLSNEPVMLLVKLAESVPESRVPVCPKCDSAMVKRQATKGLHAGKFFWACSAFPKCRQVVAVGEN